jgi:hypothetical protein
MFQFAFLRALLLSRSRRCGLTGNQQEAPGAGLSLNFRPEAAREVTVSRPELDLSLCQSGFQLIFHKSGPPRLVKRLVEARPGIGGLPERSQDASTCDPKIQSQTSPLNFCSRRPGSIDFFLSLRKLSFCQKSSRESGLHRDLLVGEILGTEFLSGLQDKLFGILRVPLFDGQLGECDSSFSRGTLFAKAFQHS